VTANWRPDLRYQIAFNCDPNDPFGVPIWVDFTAFLRQFNQATRGRQYELNQTQAGAPTMTLEDVNEYLNPANTSSPYYPNVAPYRQCLLQAMWANPGSGNLLNTAARAQVTGTPAGVAYDPSFENQTTGATVPWMAGVGFEGGNAPVVSTTTPRTGSKDVTYPVFSGGISDVDQGTSFPVPCTPGVQYTTSVYLRQDTANTQTCAITDQSLAVDAFNRTTASGWGTADYGGAWTVSGGTAANYSTAVGSPIPWLGSAAQSNAAVNTVHLSTVGSSILNSDQRVTVTVPVAATGAEIDAGLVARFADASNHYFVELRFNTDTTVGIRLQRRVAGVNTSIASATLSFAYAAGTSVQMRFRIIGTSVQAKGWVLGSVEPINWDIDTLDTTITAAGALGCRSVLNASNTNTLPVALTYSSYTSVGSAIGNSTTTTGSYVRLSVTYTATQPFHTFQVYVPASNSAGLDGTVFLDDIQHEEAGSASTFTTSGTVLYPVLRDYVERWPSAWQTNSQGFEGIALVTCVDAFGPMTATPLTSAYIAAVLATDPAYYWPLWEPSGSQVFGEVVNGGPPMIVTSATTTTSGGTATSGDSTGVLGDPGGTGVTTAGGTSTNHGVTLQSTPTIPLVIPSTGATWAVSFAIWMASTDATNTFGFVDLANLATGNMTSILRTAFGDLHPFSGTVYTPIAGGSSTADAPGTYIDGLPHLLVATNSLAADSFVTRLYVDGVLVVSDTSTASVVFGTATPAFGLNAAEIAGGNFGGDIGDGVNATYSHLAVWRREITATEVSNLYQAGTGWSGETSGQRITRYLTGATVNAAFSVAPNYSGPTNIDLLALSVMGVDDLTTGTDLLTACQNVATTENGVFWVGPTGAATFAGREIRYLETTSSYTFGEDVAGGEFPYQPDILFDYDPTLIYETVQVTNADGIIAIATPTSPAYARRFFNRGYQRTVNVLDDNEAIDAANYLLNQHKQPTQRVDKIVLDPVAYPTLWPLVLTIEIGTRVTVKRRAKAGNSGVGLTMSADYYVEKISHEGVDMAASTWKTTIQLSPVDLSQVWILENTTYGILDSTTILGY
jgi:hypothetical protein